jgi:hypothetical protein
VPTLKSWLAENLLSRARVNSPDVSQGLATMRLPYAQGPAPTYRQRGPTVQHSATRGVRNLPRDDTDAVLTNSASPSKQVPLSVKDRTVSQDHR